MKQITKISFSFLLVFIFFGTAEAQEQILIEDFEDGTVEYSTSVAEFNDGAGDFFTRTDGSGLGGYTVSNVQGTNFFAAMDLDGDGESSEQTLTFSDINIAGYESLELRVYLAEDDDGDGAEQDWDAEDFVHFDYDIDNSGTFTELLWVENPGGTNAAPQIDTNFDGTGDGSEITNSFVQYTPSISGTGGSLDLKITLNLDDGDTDIAIDNIEVWGTSTGGTPTQLAVTEINGGNSPSVDTPFDVVVQAQDGSGTPLNVSSDTDITLNLGAGNGTLSGTLSGTISNGSNQTTISGVNYSTAESSVSITATDDASNLSPGTSSTFEVLTAADELVFTDVPSGGVKDVALETFKVEARRSSDNSVDLNYSSDISISLNTGTGNLGGTLQKSSNNGVATFDDITINSAGNFTLEASDGALTSTPSSTITIVDVSIVLNEFLADPPAGSTGDANGDGTRDFDNDEFVEFVNVGSTNLDISGWLINDGDGDTHTFPNPTILSPNQAIVIFGGGSPTGNFGGSIIQTTGSLSLGNSSGQIILKNSSDIEIINYNYGSEAGNDQSVTLNPDLTGTFEDHTTADTDDGSEFSPGTRVDGSTFQPRVTFTGGEGWRMISSPTQNNTYDDLLFDLWTQGSTGADYSSGDPNVMIFDGSSFSAVSDLESDMMVSGEGFIVYVYSDDDYDQSPNDAGFPKTLDVFGALNSGSINAPMNSGSGSFSLMGNPYNEPIDWDNLNYSGLEGTVYVYDHSYGNINGGGDDKAETRNNVGGGYRTWNSSGLGSLSGGIIAPFQGFWVESSGTTPSLTFEESAKTTGGTFYTKENNNVISLRLRSEMGNMYSEAFLSFTESGQLGDDKNDGLKLSPLDFRDYMSLSTEVEGTQMDINNLPVELYNHIEIPLHVQAFEAVESGWTLMGGEVTLSWPEMNNIPSEWDITLTDTRLNKNIDLKSVNQYVFEAEGSRAKIPGKDPFNPFNPKPFQKEKAVSDARFLITINPNVPDGLIDNNIPDQFTLEQNYPNPFNPSTNIKFEIAETSDVTLNVYNVMGQRIATLVNESKTPGTYEISWDAREMASGIYYYRLRAGGAVFNRQMTLIK